MSMVFTSTTTANSSLTKQLVEIKGIGPERAKDLIKAGVKKISDLKREKYNKLLSDEARLFVQLNPLNKIPNADIKTLEPYILRAIPNAVLVGSYRRGKPFSSDIDVMVVSDDSNALNTAFEKLTHVFDKLYVYSKGPDKMSLILQFNGSAYKMDVFRTAVEDSTAMLLYSTGSKEFNVSQRSRAKKLGYLLNQKGLFKNGVRIPLSTERDYFDTLQMPYKTPSERV